MCADGELLFVFSLILFHTSRATATLKTASLSCQKSLVTVFCDHQSSSHGLVVLACPSVTCVWPRGCSCTFSSWAVTGTVLVQTACHSRTTNSFMHLWVQQMQFFSLICRDCIAGLGAMAQSPARALLEADLCDGAAAHFLSALFGCFEPNV